MLCSLPVCLDYSLEAKESIVLRAEEVKKYLQEQQIDAQRHPMIHEMVRERARERERGERTYRVLSRNGVNDCLMDLGCACV